ncbi:unnamed protein product [Gadus morhua 'NCC']
MKEAEGTQMDIDPGVAELREAAARSLGLRRRFYLLQPELRHRSGRYRCRGACRLSQLLCPTWSKGGYRIEPLFEKGRKLLQLATCSLVTKPGTGQGLAGLQPGPPSSQFESDALSLAASANLFNEAMTEGDASHTLDEASCSSAQGSLQGAADTSMAAVLRTAPARLQLDAAQTESA